MDVNPYKSPEERNEVPPKQLSPIVIELLTALIVVVVVIAASWFIYTLANGTSFR